MIIFAKADGQVVNTQPTPIYQGSSLKGSVYLVAPFPSSNGVTIQFQLPNGNVTKAYPMTPTGEIEGVKFENTEMSIWVWDVKNAMVTAIPGTVGLTITVFNGEPNITYYGEYATLTAIENIENPQTNAYAYCREDEKVYKYDGNSWVESVISVSSNDYVKTTITSSFPVIKGTPSVLLNSFPTTNEWETIVKLYGEVAGKVAYPLMTNFEYNPLTGESKKIYNNGSIQEETFPAINQNDFVEYNSFTKTPFTDTWSNSDKNGYAYSLSISNPTIATTDFDVAIFKDDENIAEKMNPFIVIDKVNSMVLIYSNAKYSGYALFFWKGSYVEQNYLPQINTAIGNCEKAVEDCEKAIDDVNAAIYNRAEISYKGATQLGSQYTLKFFNSNNEGPAIDFTAPRGPEGPQGPKGETGSQGPEGPTGPQGSAGVSFLVYKGSIGYTGESYINVTYLLGEPIVGSTVVDMHGDLYTIIEVSYVENYPTIKVASTGVNIRGEGVPSGGSAGQVLTKTATGTAWADAQGGGGKVIGYVTSRSTYWETSLASNVYILPKGFENYKFIHPEYGSVTLTKQQLESGSGIVYFNSNPMYALRVLDADSSYVPWEVSSEVYGVTGYFNYYDDYYDTDVGQLLLIATE